MRARKSRASNSVPTPVPPDAAQANEGSMWAGRTCGPERRERVAVAALMLLIALPLSIYTSVAVSASRKVTEGQALARGTSAAQLAAQALDAGAPGTGQGTQRDDYLRFTVLDGRGMPVPPVAGAGSLASYAPFVQGAAGHNGSVKAPAPYSGRPAVVGYAPVRRTGGVVLSVQDLDTVLASDRLLVHLLSFLLAPVLALLLPTVWILIGRFQRERAMARQLAAKNDRLRELDQARAAFLGSVSHDLRTPLAAMHLSLSGLMEDSEARTHPNVWATVHGALDEIDRLSARVRNLLDLARLEATGAPAVQDICDLTDIAAEALDRVRPMMAGWTIQEDFPPEPLLVECDHAQMQTVVINLLENAVKYSPMGTQVSLRGQLLAGQAVVTVSDQGPGIHPGDEERVFERYYRAPGAGAQSGSGVGLAICKTVVEWHGGRIGVRPAQGGGAAFWFALPSADVEAPTHAVVSVAGPGDTRPAAGRRGLRRRTGH